MSNIPTDIVRTNAFKLSIVNDKPIYLNYWIESQNNEVYKVTSNPFSQPEVILQNNLQSNLIRPGNNFISPIVDANRGTDLAPYNQGPMIPADFDPNNQYIGLMTPLDLMFNSKKDLSPNPMDPNWGGHSFTQSKIDSGDYTGDEIHGLKQNYNNMLLNSRLINNSLSNTSDNAYDENWKGEKKTMLDIKYGKFNQDKVKKMGENKIQNPNIK